MLEIITNKKSGSGFDLLHTFEGWKVAFITYSSQYDQMQVVKRHNKTDECFVLIKGSATLHTSDDTVPLNFTQIELEKEKLYNVKKGTWHHLKVSLDALIVVIENSNTSKENTDVFDILTNSQTK